MAAVVSALPTLLSTRCRAASKDVAHATDESPVVVMFNVAMVGHVNPTLSLVQELVRRGCRVHYFLPPGEEFRAPAREAGAVVESYLMEDSPDFALDKCGDFSACEGVEDRIQVWPLASTLQAGEHILGRCRELRPQLAVYDPMTPHGLLVAKKMEIPGVSLVTYPGFGCMGAMLGDEEKLKRWARLREPLALEVLRQFGVDLEGTLVSRLQWYSEDMNLVTTSESLVVPLPEEGSCQWADEMRARFPWAAVGCTANDSAPHISGPPQTTAAKAPPKLSPSGTVSSSFPSEELACASARGAKVIFAALGSMSVGERWTEDMAGLSSGGLPPGTTGKAFCQQVWGVILEAMRQLGDGYHCVLCVGRQADALDFLPDGLEGVPSNVTLRSALQQVVLLNNHASVFVTHAGFNSLQESLIAGVPMIAFPQAVDQPANSQKIEAEGWGKAFMRPMETTAGQLIQAVQELSATEGPYARAVKNARGELQHGDVRAVERLMQCMS